jgi:hypothetical protein
MRLSDQTPPSSARSQKQTKYSEDRSQNRGWTPIDGKPASIAASTLGHGAQWQELLDSGLCRALGCRPARGTLPLVPPQDDAQFFMQPPMCAEKPQAYRYAGYAQPFGNFLRGVLQNIAQQADLPEVRRKLGDRAGQERAHLAPSVTFFGILLAGGELFSEIVPGLAAVFLQGNEFGIAALAKQVDRCIRGDSRDPSVQAALRFVRIAGELIEPGEGLQQGLLLCVLRVGGIPRQPQCAAVKSRRIRKDELSERSSVAPARFTEQARTTGGAKVSLGPVNCCSFQIQGCATHLGERGGMRSATDG